jgi:polyphosphate kinase
MPRNLYNRVELLTPVEEEDNRAQLADVLDRAFADNTNAWELGSDGVWSRLTTNGDPPRNLQSELLELHAERAKEVVHTV